MVHMYHDAGQAGILDGNTGGMGQIGETDQLDALNEPAEQALA